MSGPKVYVAWGQSPIGFDTLFASWTEVTTHVLDDPGVEINRGAADESQNVEATTARFVLRNDDGDYTPGFQGGANWPDVIRGLPVKVTYDDVTRFVGFVDSFTLEWPGLTRDYGTVSVAASGVFQWLAQSSTLRPTLSEEILKLGPVFYYPCDDPTGSGQLTDVSGNGAAPVVVPWTLGQDTDTALIGGERSLVPNVATGRSSVCTPGVPITAGQGSSIIVWFRTDAPADIGNDTISIVSFTTVSAGWMSFVASGTGVPNNYYGYDPSDETAGYIPLIEGGSTEVSDGLWHQWAVVADSSSDGVLYIDGIAVDTDTLIYLTEDATPDLTSFLLGRTFGDLVRIAHFAAFDYELQASDILSLYEAAALSFSGETPDERVERIAGYVGQTAEVTASLVPLGIQEVSGVTALDAMRSAANSDLGLLYETLNGAIGYLPSTVRSGLGTETAYLTLDGTANEVAAIQPVYDDQKLTNQAQVSTDTGAGAYTNDASVAAYDVRGIDLETEALSADYAQHMAEWSANVYAEMTEGYPDARPRTPQVTVYLHANSTLKTAWLVGDPMWKRLTVDSPPPQLLGPLELVIEGYTERMNQIEYTVTVNCSPLVTCFTVGDATLGALHPRGHTLYADITDSATSLSVVVPTEAPAWITTGPFPDIDIDGEFMTVSAIAALSSGRQTFTVARGAGGTTNLAHTAGATVQLRSKHVIAL